jgi:putative transposase
VRQENVGIENDAHFYSVVRYVEQNALRAGIVERAGDWRWGSLHQRTHQRHETLLADWPLPQPSDGTEYVNLPQTEAYLEAIRRCVRRGSPYRDTAWTERTTPLILHQRRSGPRSATA